MRQPSQSREALTLPGATAIGVIRDIGRATVIAIGPVARIVSRSVIIRARCDRAADNGAAEQSRGDTDAEAAFASAGAGVATAETARVATAADAISDFFMAVPFSRCQDSKNKFLPGAKVPYLVERSMNETAILATNLGGAAALRRPAVINGSRVE